MTRIPVPPYLQAAISDALEQGRITARSAVREYFAPVVWVWRFLIGRKS